MSWGLNVQSCRCQQNPSEKMTGRLHHISRQSYHQRHKSNGPCSEQWMLWPYKAFNDSWKAVEPSPTRVGTRKSPI